MRFKCLLFLACLMLLPVVAWADTHTAESVSYADVLTAYNAASAGDTVAIPAGNATWSSTLAINKGIIIQGAGLASTRIDCSGTTTLMNISLSSDVSVRITGIHFKYSTNNLGGRAIQITGKTDGGFAYTKIRIDHCKFEKGTRPVFSRGWVYGVIDNNEFLNANIAVGIAGDDNHSWSRTIVAGTANAVFIEDNTFTTTNDADQEPNQHVYLQEGAQTVIRYNTFTATAYTNGISSFFDTHGNQDYYDGSGDFRAQPITEVYENTFAGHHSYGSIDLRGGSILFWNNAISLISGSPPKVEMWEEEAWSSHFLDNYDTAWPAEDQINNTFLWGNTFNGAAQQETDFTWNIPNSCCTGSGVPMPCCTGSGTGTCDDTFIQKDRDFFLHAPQSSGGKESYTDRAGAAGNAADGTMTFSAEGANAYYPYTPYTYPHPLRTLSGTPGAPKNLRLE